MGETMRLHLFILVILLLISPVNAFGVDTATEAGKEMVNGGINAWLDSQSNSIISFADGMTANTTRSPGQMALFHLITYSYDPFENPGILFNPRQSYFYFYS
jgi:hypothetical protein